MIRRFQICKDLADEHSDIKKEPKAELVVLFKIATRYKINIKNWLCLYTLINYQKTIPFTISLKKIKYQERT